MKKISALLVTLLVTCSIYAQDFTSLANLNITTAEQCRTYDNKALEAANYILTTAIDGTNNNRFGAMSFLVKWMSSTPDYTFEIGGTVTKMGKKDDFLLAVYMAGMVKFCMENKDKAKDKKEVELAAMHTLAVYAANESNNVKLDKDLKKLIAADKEGKLKEYLKL